MSAVPDREGDVSLLLTAEEAFPAFEEAVLGARKRIVAGFRIFDPMTRLRSDAGLAVGRDWFDLLVHILRKGVQVDVMLSDFDPIVSPDMHRLTWSSMRKLWAIAEMAGPGVRLRAVAAMHPAHAGVLARLALWPRVARELAEVRDSLNVLSPGIREARLRDLPGLRRWLAQRPDGKLAIIRYRPPDLYPVTHHQKLAVIDGELLYVGGLDLNPRRYDTLGHHRPGRETWYDVQLMVRGRAAAQAQLHLDSLREVTEGTAEPAPEADEFLTTVSARRSNPIVGLSPVRLRSSIDRELKSQIRASSSLIYLESQFFRDRALCQTLIRAARRQPGLELVMILPAAPEVVAFEGRRKLDARFGEYLQARCVRAVRAAFGDRVYVAAPAQRRSVGPGVESHRDRHRGAPLIYVHAKLCVFDRRSVMISSANLNGRSLHWDTEAGLLTRDPAFAAHVLRRTVAHWMPDADIDPDRPLVPQIRDCAERDAVRQPENREGLLLPYDLEPAMSFGRPLPGIPDEMV